jgi:hypothetical protein
MLPWAPTPDEVVARACEATGLSDFGGDSYREGLEVFLEAMDRDAPLTAHAVDQYIATLVRRLSNRLKIEDWYHHHPEVADTPVKGPTAVMGVPRTGTSALVNMLALDPTFRVLRSFEAAAPVPPLDIATEHEDPRYAGAAQLKQRLGENRSPMMAMHLFDPLGPEEDFDLLGLDVKAMQGADPLFSYIAWWRSCDMTPCFEYHARTLALLHSRRPPNDWVLKAPHYNFHVPAFTSAYPDTRFVVTHRDPVQAIPSACSIITSQYPSKTTAPLDLTKVGPFFLEHFAEGKRRELASRARLGPERFFDVQHRALNRDPVGTLRQIYAFLDRQFPDDLGERVEVWVDENRSGSHGVHQYTLEEFGLSAARIRAEFAEYITAFDVPVDDGTS